MTEARVAGRYKADLYRLLSKYEMDRREFRAKRLMAWRFIGPILHLGLIEPACPAGFTRPDH